MTLPRHSPTVREAADYLGVDHLTVQRMIADGRLETDFKEPFPCPVGFRWRLKPDSVERERALRLIRQQLRDMSVCAKEAGRLTDYVDLVESTIQMEKRLKEVRQLADSLYTNGMGMR
jgi:excisionase family DNA binding protein